MNVFLLATVIFFSFCWTYYLWNFGYSKSVSAYWTGTSYGRTLVQTSYVVGPFGSSSDSNEIRRRHRPTTNGGGGVAWMVGCSWLLLIKLRKYGTGWGDTAINTRSDIKWSENSVTVAASSALNTLGTIAWKCHCTVLRYLFTGVL